MVDFKPAQSWASASCIRRCIWDPASNATGSGGTVYEKTQHDKTLQTGELSLFSCMCSPLVLGVSSLQMTNTSPFRGAEAQRPLPSSLAFQLPGTSHLVW